MQNIVQKTKRAKLYRGRRSRKRRSRVQEWYESMKGTGGIQEDINMRKGRKEKQKRGEKRNMNNLTYALFPSKYQADFRRKWHK